MEMFTGKRAFEATNVANLMSIHESAPSRPSSLIGDIDPLAERIILRCLERDPAQRPKSALDVARGLPGGDPLAAALAGGRNAVAGDGRGVGRRRRHRTANRVDAARRFCSSSSPSIFALTPYSSDIVYLRARGKNARDARRACPSHREERRIQRIALADTAYGLGHNSEFLTYRSTHLPAGKDIRDLEHAEQPAYNFTYRQSPRSMIPRQPSQYVANTDPPLEVAGMVNVTLTTRGDLVSFLALPPQAIPAAAWTQSYPPVDWNQWFIEAGLDPARFEPEEPIWAPLMAFDARAGFRGSYAANPAATIHVIANSFQGKPVYFHPSPARGRAPDASTLRRRNRQFNVAQNIFVGIQVVMVIAAIYLARRNWLLGRGDQVKGLRPA